MARLSGLQRQVLSLYRSMLRASRAKEQAGGEPIAAFGRQEFDKYRGLDKKDIQRIEHLLRRGRRQLELFQAAEVSGVRLGTPGGSNRAGGGGGGGGGGAS